MGKICFLGGGLFVVEWAEYFAKNHDVSLITFGDISDLKNKDITTYYIHKIKEGSAVIRGISLASTFLTGSRIVKNIGADLVCGLFLSTYGFMGALSKVNPLVTIALGSDIAVDPYRSYSKFTARYAIKKSDMIIVQDHLGKKQILNIMPDYDGEIEVIPWGVDISLFHPSNTKKEYDIIVIDKRNDNIDLFLNAIYMVKKEIGDVNAIWIGYKPSRQERYMIAKLGLSENVMFIGEVLHDDIKEFIDKSKIFVDTFIPEDGRIGHSYGMALLEAMACGVPTLAPKRPTVMFDGEHKWYYGELYDDYISLYEKIVLLLDDKNLCKDIANKNRDVMERKFDANKNMSRIEEVFNYMMG